MPLTYLVDAAMTEVRKLRVELDAKDAAIAELERERDAWLASYRLASKVADDLTAQLAQANERIAEVRELRQDLIDAAALEADRKIGVAAMNKQIEQLRAQLTKA